MQRAERGIYAWLGRNYKDQVIHRTDPGRVRLVITSGDCILPSIALDPSDLSFYEAYLEDQHDLVPVYLSVADLSTATFFVHVRSNLCDYDADLKRQVRSCVSVFHPDAAVDTVYYEYVRKKLIGALFVFNVVWGREQMEQVWRYVAHVLSETHELELVTTARTLQLPGAFAPEPCTRCNGKRGGCAECMSKRGMMMTARQFRIVSSGRFQVPTYRQLRNFPGMQTGTRVDTFAACMDTPPLENGGNKRLRATWRKHEEVRDSSLIDGLTRLVRAFHMNYRSVNVQRVYKRRDGCFIVLVSGRGSGRCQNVDCAHEDAPVYFLVDGAGIAQRCLSLTKKEDTKFKICACAEYTSRGLPHSKTWKNRLFGMCNVPKCSDTIVGSK